MRLIPLAAFIFFLLGIGVLANHESYNQPYGSYGPYGNQPNTASLTYQQSGTYSGNPFPYANYLRYKNHWNPFDFKLSRTVNHDIIENLIKSFDGEDLDLLFALADLNKYDGFDDDYILDHYLQDDDFNCLYLDAYNTLSDLDDADQYDPINLGNLDTDSLDNDFLRRFDYADYQKIANADPNDNIDPITASNAKDLDFEDLDCYDLRDYNSVAALNPSDKWNVIDFTDFDDLDDLDKIGRKRVVFFHPDDFEHFNLYNTVNPRWNLYAPYIYGPYTIPDGNYGLYPPYGPQYYDNCYNTTFSPDYCSGYNNYYYQESGSFHYSTDINFDNQNRQQGNTGMGSNGARRPASYDNAPARQENAGGYSTLQYTSAQYPSPGRKTSTVQYQQTNTQEILQNFNTETPQEGSYTLVYVLVILIALIAGLIGYLFVKRSLKYTHRHK